MRPYLYWPWTPNTVGEMVMRLSAQIAGTARELHRSTRLCSWWRWGLPAPEHSLVNMSIKKYYMGPSEHR